MYSCSILLSKTSLLKYTITLPFPYSSHMARIMKGTCNKGKIEIVARPATNV